jgi:hypothetical protein
MKTISREWLEFMREQYPVGSRVTLREMKDPYAPVEPGMTGTLKAIDDIGTFHVDWDNGRMLGLVIGEDSFSIRPPAPTLLRLYMPMTADCYERNKWGDLDDEPLELDSRQALQYADNIAAALGREFHPEEAERGLMKCGAGRQRSLRHADAARLAVSVAGRERAPARRGWRGAVSGNANGKVENLSKAIDEVAHHNGNVWTPVVALRRVDAERLGYMDAENWRALVCSCMGEMAEAYKIHPDHLRWYAAFHRKDKQVHIHLVVFSTDPKEGYLTKEGIRKIKSAFAREIYKQDLIQIYGKQTQARNTLQQDAASLMSRLIYDMDHGAVQNDRLAKHITELATQLETVSGKKVYGYLPKPVKQLVREIVDELSRDARVASAYELWQQMREEVCRTYNDKLPERLPLSEQKEFNAVRIMVIREALALSSPAFAFDDETMPDETEEEASEENPPHASPYRQAEIYRSAKRVLADPDADSGDKAAARDELEKLWLKGYSMAAHQLGKLCRDGVTAAPNAAAAAKWFRLSAMAGNDCSAYALGKLLLSLGDAEGLRWLRQSAERHNPFASYQLGKAYLTGSVAPRDADEAKRYLTAAAEAGNPYAQYALGKLLLLGQDAPRDTEEAVRWLTLSAGQGNAYGVSLISTDSGGRAPDFFGWRCAAGRPARTCRTGCRRWPAPCRGRPPASSPGPLRSPGSRTASAGSWP